MKLDRNINDTGRGKYGLINNRKLREIVTGDSTSDATRVDHAITVLMEAGVIEWGEPGTEGEFFVIKLRDINADVTLLTYARSAAHHGDAELGRDVEGLVLRSGPQSPFCKKPD